MADGVAISIPVLPDKLEVSSPSAGNTATVLGLGEVLLLRERRLRTVNWKSYFPLNDAPHVTGDLQSPTLLVRAIEDAMTSKNPITLELEGSTLDVNMKVGIEEFKHEERGGAVGDIYYSIKLIEWKPHRASTLDLTPEGAILSKASQSGTPAISKNHTVVSGDSLWAIAKRNYGDGGKWKAIYDANRDLIGANPNLIYAGQVLALP